MKSDEPYEFVELGRFKPPVFKAGFLLEVEVADLSGNGGDCFCEGDFDRKSIILEIPSTSKLEAIDGCCGCFCDDDDDDDCCCL